MPTLFLGIIQLLSIFAIAMIGPTFAKIVVLRQGRILTSGW